VHPALFAGSVLPRTAAATAATAAASEEGAAAGRAAAAVSSTGAIPVVMLLLLVLRLGVCVAWRSVADHVKSVGDGRLPGATSCLILAACMDE
jgi:hypothetical protein